MGYIFIYKNYGKRRVIDISIKAVMRIPGLVEYNPSLSQVINLPITGNHRFVVGDKSISNRIFVDLESIKHNKPLVKNLKISIGKEISIEDLFELNENSELTIYMLGYDELTGHRKLFESQPYKKDSVINGIFNRDTLDVE